MLPHHQFTINSIIRGLAVREIEADSQVAYVIAKSRHADMYDLEVCVVVPAPQFRIASLVPGKGGGGEGGDTGGWRQGCNAEALGDGASAAACTASDYLLSVCRPDQSWRSSSLAP